MRRVALLLGVVAAPLGAQAPAAVVGRAVDALTGSPIAGAEVRLGDLRVHSRPDGEFRLVPVPGGRGVVVALAVGYRPDTVEVEVTPGLDRRVTVALTPLPLAVAPLTVTGLPAGAAVLDGDALQGRGRDLGSAIDGWSGVSVRRSGGASAVPQVRGSAPEEVLVLVDGVAINDPLTGRADLSRVPVDQVERVVLLPGAQTARAGGRAVAGVIEVTTKPRGDGELSSGAGSYGAWTAHGAGGVGAASVAADFSRLPDDYPARARDGSPSTRLNAGGTLWNVAARVDGAVDATLRLSGSDLGLPGNITNPSPTARGSDRTALVSLRRDGAFSWHLTGEWLDTHATDSHAPPRNTSYDVTTRSAGSGGGVEWQHPAAAGAWGGTLAVGAEGRYDRFWGDAVSPGADFARAGLFVNANLGRGEWLLSPAIRVDRWSGRAGAALSGRMDGEWRRGTTAISLGVGSAVTPPVPFDLLFHEGVGVALNPGLRPERVVWEVSADLRQGFALGPLPGTLALHGYDGRVNDLVVWAAGPNFVWSPQNVNVVRRGGEAELELRPGAAWSVAAGAALSLVNFTGAPHYPVAYRPRDTEHARVGWAPAGWRFDLDWRRLGARPQFDNGDFNLPAIGLLDAGAERRLGQAFLLRLDVRDLTDRRPEYVAGLPLPGRTITLTLTYGVQ